jgi:nitrite reductase/ring-hydroxylating ferredoxin subunit
MSLMDFFKAVAGICATKPLETDKWERDGAFIKVRVNAVPELQSLDGAVYLSGKGLPKPVLIVKKPEGFLCVENRCTHMGRKLDPMSDGSLRCCSVSHARFDQQGNKLSGPASGPVRVYPSDVQEGVLKIDCS